MATRHKILIICSLSLFVLVNASARSPAAVSPVYYPTVSALLSSNPPSGTVVELNCKPVTSSGSSQYGSYFVIKDDGASSTLRIYSTSPADSSQRVNKVTGQIRSEGASKVLCVDSGPGYDPDIHIGFLQTAAAGTIAWAKTFPDSASLTAPLEAKLVSRVFPGLGCFYVQETDGSAGIRINNDLAVLSIAPGELVSIALGTMTTSGGERAVNAGQVIKLQSNGQLEPWGVSNKYLVGGSFNALTPGPAGGTGPFNAGLLVKTWGKVTSTGPGYFYIDDGSRVSNGAGVRVEEVYGSIPQQNNFVAVEGIASVENGISGYNRMLRLGVGPPSSSGDNTGIQYLASTPRPVSMMAVSTGSGKISVYWQGVPGASGYNIYRGTVSGGENYSQPINGSTPVSSPTYPGGNVYMFTDNGLIDGKQYYYTVKAVGVSGLSEPSDEISETPSPYAVPWDSADSSSITAAIQSHFYPDFDYIRAVGPDGRVYDSVSATPALPDGAFIPGTNLLNLVSGVTIAAPNDAGYDGLYRRVKSGSGYMGSTGVFNLTGWSSINLVSDRPDTYYIYLGNRDDGILSEVSGGLGWSGVWQAFQLSVFRTSSGSETRLINYCSRSENDFISGSTAVIKEFVLEEKSMSVVTISGANTSGQKQSVCLVNAYPSKGSACQARRVHCIAHGYPKDYRTTGSYTRSGDARSMKLLDTSYDPVSWTASVTADNTGYPPSPTVTWHVISAYTDEDQINLGP